MRLGSNVRYQTVAILDLGSNTFQLVLARSGPGGSRILERNRVPVRLGAGLREGHLDRKAAKRAFNCLRRFRKRIDEFAPDIVRAVGTAAFRHLDREFLQTASQALGHPIEVVSGDDEARLVHRGVHALRGTERHDSTTLILDIGGGSTECIIGCGETMQFVTSIPWGAGNLTRNWQADGTFTGSDYDRAKRSALEVMHQAAEQASHLEWDHCVGTASTIKKVHRVARRRGWAGDEFCIDALGALERLVRNEGAHTIPEGRDPEWSDALAGGLALVSAAFQVFGIQTLEPCGGAFRTGLLHETAEH